MPKASSNAFRRKVPHQRENCIGIGIIHKLVHVRESLVTIYKSFVRPHIDYGDIITMITFVTGLKEFNIMLRTCNYWCN